MSAPMPLVLPATLALAYVIGVSRGGRPGRRAAAWAAGVAALALALSPPLDAWADARLSAHMVQHLLLTMVAAPLLAAGAPVRLALRTLRRGGRRRLARALHLRAVRVLAHPALGWAALTAVMLGTHLTPLYGLALRHPLVHASEHLAYLVAAVLYWAPLIGADPLPGRPGAAGRLAWLLAAMPPMGLIGAWLLTGPLRYPEYAGPGALADQRQAASVMWVGGSLMLAGATVGLAFGAMVTEERRQVRREAAADRRRAAGVAG
jgi:cytochrome c oxidase assembly factor CtaG